MRWNKWLKLTVGSALLGSVLFSGSPAYAAAPSVFVNGELQYDAMMVKGNAMIKLRALTDPAWIVFAYDPKTRVVMFHTKDNKITVKLREGEKKATVNDKSVPIDAAVVNKGGLTYVPLRFISETLGAYVKYNAQDNRVIVRTPTAQQEYETLMHGDLTEAREIALKLPKISGDAPMLESGEGYHHYGFTFPEGEAQRYIFDNAGYDYGYYEVNEEGLAIKKWQYDEVAKREWGVKPTFGSSVYFSNYFMGGVYYYGKTDAQGNNKELGRLLSEEVDGRVVPIEGEKRTNARP
ncbi:copper amine oxidase N-terminal domain-containing protein [Paenibacillus guangzhouensis]|uniref:copper amine oxidase N-terminal domain-containing protein n=1 Tax=Paenibacillus guangzhouensis TaxID=1473112 RepID=UPI0012678050|nr:copper amine oxidase N-terminal domain-containing protein [Paenibacillus guangzhouensis]